MINYSGIYDHIETSRDNIQIPVFKSGKFMESKYSPVNEAKRIVSSLEKSYSAFLILGAGSGTLINEIINVNKDALIIAVETSEEDIKFINAFVQIHKLKENKNIIFTTIQNLYETLINNYFPAKYGDLKIIEQKAWILENQNYIKEISEIIQHSLNIISADYSVQAHFGKIWVHNILSNISSLQKHPQKNEQIFAEPDTSKTAAIIAAGPSLDKTLNLIQSQREKYFIICTDTAFQSLSRRNIQSDIVVSIDAQNISASHFFPLNKIQNTLFAFDLCASSSAAARILENNGNVRFFVSGHPLASFINNAENSIFPYVYSGSGTVTISAVSIAKNLGFKDVQIFGADFSYHDGKPYTKGTYLENQFLHKSNKIISQENSFSKLMYRTELEEIEKQKFTNQVLCAYKSSLEDFIKKDNSSFKIENDIYKINFLQPENFSNTKKNFTLVNPQIIKKGTSEILKLIESAEEKIQELIYLPLIAALRNNVTLTNKEKISDISYIELKNLAHSIFLSYN